jgi:hypothetical protein
MLDTMLAIPEMLQPKALVDAVAMVMHASKPHHLSRTDFIECFEVLMASGITAPLNALLAAPAPRPRARGAAYKEALECHPPRLHAGPKSKKLRDQAARDPRRQVQSSCDEFRIECKQVPVLFSFTFRHVASLHIFCTMTMTMICLDMTLVLQFVSRAA